MGSAALLLLVLIIVRVFETDDGLVRTEVYRLIFDG